MPPYIQLQWAAWLELPRSKWHWVRIAALHRHMLPTAKFSSERRGTGWQLATPARKTTSDTVRAYCAAVATQASNGRSCRYTAGTFRQLLQPQHHHSSKTAALTLRMYRLQASHTLSKLQLLVWPEPRQDTCVWADIDWIEARQAGRPFSAILQLARGYRHLGHVKVRNLLSNWDSLQVQTTAQPDLLIFCLYKPDSKSLWPVCNLRNLVTQLSTSSCHETGAASWKNLTLCLPLVLC